MKKITLFILVISCQLLAISYSAKAQYSILLTFSDTNGKSPVGSLILSGAALYGMTEYGGIHGGGNVFTVDTNGNNAVNLYNFYAGTPHGSVPVGNVILVGSKVYGMTKFGGLDGYGNIYSMDTNGSGYRDLWDFDKGGDTNGSEPMGSLTLLSGKFYGMTYQGGLSKDGNIFSIDTNGSGYKDLWDFNYNGINGAYPQGALTIAGGKFYGMTGSGGVNYMGNIFAIDTTGINYKDLDDFAGTTGAINGSEPKGSLTYSAGKLFGMTESGGVNTFGNAFSIDTNGTSYTDLLDFNDLSSPQGAYPLGSLTLANGILYGMTSQGGANYSGNIFSIDTNYNPSSYVDLIDLGGTNGELPGGDLTRAGNILYGMTSMGGANGNGDIFSIDTNGSGFNVDYSFGFSNDGYAPQASLILSAAGTLYGVTPEGGVYSNGTLISIDTTGSNYVQRYSFGQGSANGEYPLGNLFRAGNTFYGMTYQGGKNSYGNIFSMNANGTGYKDVWNFADTAGTNGQNPYGSLIRVGTYFYGMTYAGGANNKGLIFSISAKGYKDLLDFGGTVNAANPRGSLIFSGGKLYGMTVYGGVNSDGNVFSVDTNGGGYKDLWDFGNNGGTSGAYPQGSLILSAGKLYGMTNQGGANSNGNIFSIDTSGSDYKNIWSFDNTNTNGAYPQGSLLLSGYKLYGMTSGGGTAYDGVLFSVDTTGSNYKDLVNFSNSNGVSPYGSLILAQGSLYGMTNSGGGSNAGVVFREQLMSVAITNKSVACYGDSTGSGIAVVGGAGNTPYTYTWALFGGDTLSRSNPSGSVLPAGFYIVTVTDNTGLAVREVVNITQPAALIATTSSTPDNGTHIGTATATPGGGTLPYTYLWSVNAGSQTTTTATGLAAGTYTCTITDNHDCDDIVTDTVKASLGIQNISNASSISIYPNPSTGNFIVSCHAELVSASQTIEVYNVLGEQVYNATLKQVQGDNNINLSTQPNGVYLYRVITETGNLVGQGKLIIQK